MFVVFQLLGFFHVYFLRVTLVCVLVFELFTFIVSVLLVLLFYFVGFALHFSLSKWCLLVELYGAKHGPQDFLIFSDKGQKAETKEM